MIEGKTEYESTVLKSKEFLLKYTQKINECVRIKIIENNELKFNNFDKRYKSYAEATDSNKKKNKPKEKQSIIIHQKKERAAKEKRKIHKKKLEKLCKKKN